MENAVEALKMAFAVMAFMLALSVSIISFNKVKSTADVILYAKDETNYYEYYQDYDGKKGKAAENRVVGLETIIPTLYKYYKENYTVVFRKADYNPENGTFSNVEPLTLYYTPSRYRSGKDGRSGKYLWGERVGEKDYSTYDLIMYNKYSTGIFKTGIFDDIYDRKGSKEIFSFDLEEETLRHEPWTGSYEKAKENLKCFLNGEIYYNPGNNEEYINYSKLPLKDGGFIAKYRDAQFIETIGEYTYSSNQSGSYDTEDEEGSTINSLVKDKKKRMIIFTLID